MSVSKMLGSIVELGKRPGQPGDEVVDHDRVEAEVRGQRLAGVERVLGEAADPGDLGPEQRGDDVGVDAATSTARSAPAQPTARRRPGRRRRRRRAGPPARGTGRSAGRWSVSPLRAPRAAAGRGGRDPSWARWRRPGGRATASRGGRRGAVARCRLHPGAVLGRELVAAQTAAHPLLRLVEHVPDGSKPSR